MGLFNHQDVRPHRIVTTLQRKKEVKTKPEERTIAPGGEGTLTDPKDRQKIHRSKAAKSAAGAADRKPLPAQQPDDAPKGGKKARRRRAAAAGLNL